MAADVTADDGGPGRVGVIPTTGGIVTIIAPCAARWRKTGRVLTKRAQMRIQMVVVIAALATVPARAVIAQTAADSAGIRATAHDYIDGWYSGDAERMERAVHSHLAKRLVATGPQGRSMLVDLTAAELIQSTRAGYGKIPRDKWRDSVTILDIYGNDAVARIDATTWVDFLQLVKWNGTWKIVNVIWENRPQSP